MCTGDDIEFLEGHGVCCGYGNVRIYQETHPGTDDKTAECRVMDLIGSVAGELRSMSEYGYLAPQCRNLLACKIRKLKSAGNVLQ